jgi:hypothetical protein
VYVGCTIPKYIPCTCNLLRGGFHIAKAAMTVPMYINEFFTRSSPGPQAKRKKEVKNLSPRNGKALPQRPHVSSNVRVFIHGMLKPIFSRTK